MSGSDEVPTTNGCSTSAMTVPGKPAAGKAVNGVVDVGSKEVSSDCTDSAVTDDECKYEDINVVV